MADNSTANNTQPQPPSVKAIDQDNSNLEDHISKILEDTNISDVTAQYVDNAEKYVAQVEKDIQESKQILKELNLPTQTPSKNQPT